MSNTKHNLYLRGVVSSQSPIMHIGNTSKDKAYAITLDVTYRDGDGELVTQSVPYVQGSSFRGRLRDAMGDVITDGMDGMLSLETAQRLYTGGALSDGVKLTLEQRRAILSNCLDVSLYGGIAGNMFPSKVKFSPLYPIVGSSIKSGIVPNDVAEHMSLERVAVKDKDGNVIATRDILTDTWALTRRNDEVYNGEPSIMNKLSFDGLEEAEAYIQIGLDKQDKKKEERKNGGKKAGEEKTKKTILMHFGKTQVIPAGTNLYSEIHITNASLEDIGLFLATMRHFFDTPFICSKSASGYGKIGMNMSAVMDGKEYDDLFKIADNGKTVVTEDAAWVKKADKAFKAWLSKATPESISVTLP